MTKELIIAILGSSFLTGIVTSLFSKSSKDKENKLQYITSERKKWRDDLRNAIVELRNIYEIKNSNNSNSSIKTYSEIKTYFQCRLNPADLEDNKILILFDEFINSESNEKLKEIEEAIAFLLKFDWERAKLEAKPHSFYKYFLSIIALLFLINQFYPISEWMNCVIIKNKEAFSICSIYKEISRLKTVLFIASLPVVLFAFRGLNILFLKICIGYPKHINKTATICSWLNIPYKKQIGE